MIVTYSVAINRRIQGNGWQAVGCARNTDTLAMDLAFDSLDPLLTWEQLVERFKNLHKTIAASGIKSWVQVYFGSDYIEVCRPNKGLPSISILKRPPNEP